MKGFKFSRLLLTWGLGSICGFVSAEGLPVGNTLPAIQQQVIDINASSGKLTSFSEALCYVENVYSVRLPSHDIAIVPDCVANLGQTLNDIDMSGNKLLAIPNGFSGFSVAEKINLSKNLIASVPEQFGQLKRIKTLDLSNNQLINLPASLGNLSALTSLSLRNNQIVELPDSMAKLNALNELDLRNNKLTKAPKFLAYLVNLTGLHIIEGNLLPASEVAVIKAIFKGRVTVID